MAGTMPKLPGIVAAIPPRVEIETLPSKATTNMISSNGGLPPFLAMPQSSAKITDRISNNSGTLLQDSDNEVSKDDYNQVIILA